MGMLRDFLGRLVDAFSLTEAIAGPSIAGGRSPYSEHPANGMTPERMARILRAADSGEPLAYFELAEDIEERDPHYASVMATRKRAVSQLPITVTAASEDAADQEHAAFIQGWIDDGVLRRSLFDMLDAIGKGVSICEIDWQLRFGRQTPCQLTWRDQRWFTFDLTDGDTVLLRDGGIGTPLAPHKFVVHRHKNKSGLTIRSGIARVAAWSWMFKSFTVKDWAMFVQNFGQPIRIGRYGRGATEAEKDVLWRAVYNIAGDCAAIIPKDMLIEFQELSSKGSTTDMYEKRADWLDRQTSKLVLGQTTTTDAVSGGHAVSREHRLVQEDIERSDALCLTDTINAQLIPNMIAFNFGPQDRYPHVRIGRPDEVPLGEFAQAFWQLAPQGLTAPVSYIRDRMGIPTPKPGEDVIGGKPSGGGKGAAGDGGTDPALNAMMDRLFTSRNARQTPDDMIAAMNDRLNREAADAMDGMIDEVRQAVTGAKDLRDAADRLAKLQLAPDALAEAMAKGMTLAHLVGQAALLDDIKANA
ncbi:DUF935 domain-containing protein [Rhizobium mayense]|uniref:DUF935 domain-containing protein n=1 Tax=Rhizobium mayense TaxID=1312184 RepID=A0ABT7JY42_9HYPH|nr:DUF935 domain-containing protein [Rhizobium mayense]MDL2401262.1 DUF935 domain-containing protein [Rhizobium mayense]